MACVRAIAFPAPIITPSTKADAGHDEDITPDGDPGARPLHRGGVEDDVAVCAGAVRSVGQRDRAASVASSWWTPSTSSVGKDGRILLIDEIHTPDSSRYFYADGYEDRQATRRSAEAAEQGVRARSG